MKLICYSKRMQKVLGIGGIFFMSNNPAKLSKWYEDNLGISVPPATYDDNDWHQEAGPTVFAPMENDSPHFVGNSNFSINFRVSNLEAMCVQLEANNIRVQRDLNEYPNGKFASLADPEGNQIQLWQPKTNK